MAAMFGFKMVGLFDIQMAFEPFNIQPIFDHSKSELVLYYSDPDCNSFIVKIIISPHWKSAALYVLSLYGILYLGIFIQGRMY